MTQKHKKLTTLLRATVVDGDEVIEIEASILLQLLNIIDDADMAITKALSALETNPLTGDKSAYAALRVYMEKETTDEL